jgi:hypothetical protein
VFDLLELCFLKLYRDYFDTSDHKFGLKNILLAAMLLFSVEHGITNNVSKMG